MTGDRRFRLAAGLASPGGEDTFSKPLIRALWRRGARAAPGYPTRQRRKGESESLSGNRGFGRVRLKVVVAGLLLLLLRPIHAYAWNAPDAGVLVGDQFLPAKTQLDPGHKYMSKAHGFIIERAVDLVATEAPNWGAVLKTPWTRQQLLDGVAFADRADRQFYVTVHLSGPVADFLDWSLLQADEIGFAPCNTASLEHFYNPDREGQQPGLDLTWWETALHNQDLVVQAAAAVLGYPEWAISACNPSVSLDPPFPPSGFEKDAATLCGEKYRLAVQAANDPSMHAPSGDRGMGAAFFYLGWACHLVADAAVVHHTYDSWFTHGAYENVADCQVAPFVLDLGLGLPGTIPPYCTPTNKGEIPEYNAYSIGAAYQPSKDPEQYVRDVATAVHTVDQFRNAEGPHDGQPADPNDRMAELTNGLENLTDGGSGNTVRNSPQADQAVQYALPIAEQYTAGLIMKFMHDIGYPDNPPLVARVEDISGHPLESARVFWAPGSPPITDKEWSYTQTDEQGQCQLPLIVGKRYTLRPAMPGYDFTGESTYRAFEFWSSPCPVTFNYPATAPNSPYSITFKLHPILAHAPSPPPVGSGRPRVLQQGPGSSSQGSPAGPTGRTRTTPRLPRLPGLPATSDRAPGVPGTRPSAPGAASRYIAAGTKLPKSGTAVSELISDMVDRTVLSVERITAPYLGVEGADCAWRSHSIDEVLEQAQQASSGTQYLPFSYVEVQLYGFQRAKPGNLLRTRGEITDAMDKFLAARQQAASGSQRVPPPVPAAGDPRQSPRPTPSPLVLRRPKGKAAGAYVLPLSASKNAVTLLAAGLAPVHEDSGAGVQVQIVPGPGYLGASPPDELTLTTDAQGKVAFLVFAGTRAGPIQVHIKVLSGPNGPYSGPETDLQFLAFPRQGADTPPVVPPALAPSPVMGSSSSEVVPLPTRFPRQPNRDIAPRVPTLPTKPQSKSPSVVVPKVPAKP